MRLWKKGFWMGTLAVALLVTGCGTGEEQEAEATPTQEAVVTAEVATQTPEATEEVEETQEPEDEFELKIYRGNEESDGLICDTVYVSDITMDTVLEQLIVSKVLSENVVLNQADQTEADGKITLLLDFNQAFQEQLQSYGSSGEMILMGAVVNSFLDAMGAEQAMITVEGEVLETGHEVYDSYLGKYEFEE